MSKFKVGDVVYLPAIIETIHEEDSIPYRVTFGDGEMLWFEEEFLRSTPTNAKTAQVKSKWFEVEEYAEYPFDNIETPTLSNMILINDIKSISPNNVGYSVFTEFRTHFITKDSYDKLKERLMEE